MCLFRGFDTCWNVTLIDFFFKQLSPSWGRVVLNYSLERIILVMTNLLGKYCSYALKLHFLWIFFITGVLPQQISNSNTIGNCHSVREQPDGENLSWRFGNVFTTKIWLKHGRGISRDATIYVTIMQFEEKTLLKRIYLVIRLTAAVGWSTKESLRFWSRWFATKRFAKRSPHCVLTKQGSIEKSNYSVGC